MRQAPCPNAAAGRRHFLRQLAAFSGMGAALPLGLNFSALSQASAQGVGDYKALVCLFLHGGNDAFNTVVATDSDAWQAYLSHRRPAPGSDVPSIALMEPGTPPDAAVSPSQPERLGGVLPIASARMAAQGRQLALHPALVRLRSRYQSGQAAVLVNIGPLTRPTSKADWANASKSKPVKLFSHNDQQSMWQTFGPEGTSHGWGGRMGDVLTGLYNGQGLNAIERDIAQHMFACMAPTGGAMWLPGQDVLGYQCGSTGVQGLGSGGRIHGSVSLHAAVSELMTADDGDLSHIAGDHRDMVRRALQANALLSAPLNNLSPLGMGPWSTPGQTQPHSDPLLKHTDPTDHQLKTNHLAVQLQMVLRLIHACRSASLGMGRQFFMVTLGGFDHHDDQIQSQAERLAALDHAIDYFYNALATLPSGLNLVNQVTTFTASEFGRTFTSNGDGSDHGWGAHHFVVGGSVMGGEVYGQAPVLRAGVQGVFSSPDQIENGALLPTTSVDHLGYALGRWMGISDAALLGSQLGDPAAILPNLREFNSSGHDLGFMRA